MSSGRFLSALLVLCVFGSALGARFYFPNFQNRPHLNLNGDSRSDFGELVLTLPRQKQAGAVWFDEPLDLKYGFNTWFDFHISKVADSGGDGFAFVVQRDNPYALGRSGNGLGYDGLENALAVEFDTKLNKDLGDESADHVSVHSALTGILSSSEKATLGQVPIADLKSFFTTVQRARRAQIMYDPEDGSLTVFVESTVPSGRTQLQQLVKANVGKIEGRFYVGFTAATSETYAQFAIRSWSFTSFESKERTTPPCR